MTAPLSFVVTISYEQRAAEELASWKAKMKWPPSHGGQLVRKLQTSINRAIPGKVHQVITAAIRENVRGVHAGAGFTTAPPLMNAGLEEREGRVRERIEFFQTAAAVEGAVTGGGGIMLGLADFPPWLTLKMKMLFEIASLYPCDTGDPAERTFILRIFELALCSPAHPARVFEILSNWGIPTKPVTIGDAGFDWRTFQQEYRDAIDIGRLLQLVPGLGVAVGALVNHRFT